MLEAGKEKVGRKRQFLETNELAFQIEKTRMKIIYKHILMRNRQVH